MNKKTYLLLFFIPLITCLSHFHNVLPYAAERMFGWIFYGVMEIGNILIFWGGLYYFLVNYLCFKNSLKKAFLFSLSSLSLWWVIDLSLYFTVGYVDNIGIFLMKVFVIYNYILLFLAWGIALLVRFIKMKRSNKLKQTEK